MNRTLILALALAGAVVAVLIAGNLPGMARVVPGKLEAPQDPNQVVHLGAATFPAFITQPKPVVVDFWAPWCGPCRTQGPILEHFKAMAGDRAMVGKVNVDDNKPLAAQFDVRSIPTLIVFKEGKEVQRFVGVQSVESLMKALN